MGALQKTYSQAVPQIISHNLKLNNPQLKTKNRQD